jgi:hypothetical protein
MRTQETKRMANVLDRIGGIALPNMVESSGQSRPNRRRATGRIARDLLPSRYPERVQLEVERLIMVVDTNTAE